MREVSFLSWKSKVETFLRFLKHFGVFFSTKRGKAILLNEWAAFSLREGITLREK